MCSEIEMRDPKAGADARAREKRDPSGEAARQDSLIVVGVGASAGGLEAIDLTTGDGASTEQAGVLTLKGSQPTEALLFDLG